MRTLLVSMLFILSSLEVFSQEKNLRLEVYGDEFPYMRAIVLERDCKIRDSLWLHPTLDASVDIVDDTAYVVQKMLAINSVVVLVKKVVAVGDSLVEVSECRVSRDIVQNELAKHELSLELDPATLLYWSVVIIRYPKVLIQTFEVSISVSLTDCTAESYLQTPYKWGYSH